MQIVGNPFFLQFGVPLIAVVLSVYLKFVTRRDEHVTFKKEDLAVGLDLLVTSLLLFITASSTLASEISNDPTNTQLVEKVSSVPWLIAMYVIGLWGASTFVRKVGWEDEDRLKLWRGVVFPGAFGVAMLFGTVSWIASP